MGRVRQKVNRLLKIIPAAQRLAFRIRYMNESRLIKGSNFNENKKTSIIHFSFNKAATQYVKSILMRCAVNNGMVQVNFDGYAFNSDFPFLQHLSLSEMEKYKHIFKKNGYLYSVFGGMVEGIPNLDEYKIVLFVRDPRDILTSRYYSISYSHGVPAVFGDKHDIFIKEQIKARNHTIDEYVISESDMLLLEFNRYNEIFLEKHSNYFLTKYEHMVDEFDVWLKSLLDYCEFNINKDLLRTFTDENNKLLSKGENKFKHVRKGKPGDYKEKLKPETVEFLNNKFSSVLLRHGYVK